MLYDVCVHGWSMCLFECEINVYLRSIYIHVLRLWNVWLVVCGGQWYVKVGGMPRSVVCGDKCCAMWGKWHGRSTVCWVSLRSVV